MAKGEDYELYDEDEACMNCGCNDYRPSKVDGLCQDCFEDLA
jgi:hypothetical protein